MKNNVLLAVAASLMTFLCLNTTYSNASDIVILNDFCDKISLNSSESNTTNTSALNSSSCAPTCGAVAAGNDCGHAIYEGQDEFPGTAANSTSSGNGSGTGCQYYGFANALQLGAGTGTSYTYCTEYTANSEEASYAAYLSAANSSCISRSVQVFNANTCGAASVGLQQPVGTFPAKATALRPGDTYVVCHTYTENGCADNFASSIFEVCMNIVELPFCSSAPAPQASIEVCSGENFEIDLGNSCVADSDLSTGFTNGLSGYAAFYYLSGGRFVSFPDDITAGSLGSSTAIRYLGESNLNNGGGCSSVVMNPIINNTCEPLEVVVGIVPVDVNSVDSPIINVLSDCKITEVTLIVQPQLTSQVTGSNIQLLTQDGTVCGTFSNSGSGNNTPQQGTIDNGSSTFPINPDTNVPRTILGQSGISNVVVIQSPVLGSVGSIDPFNQAGGTVLVEGSNNTNNSGSGSNDNAGSIPNNIPCVTPQGLAAVNDSGETLLAHTVEIDKEGQLVFTYELPVKKAKLYPNPASNQLFFTTGVTDIYTVNIYDTLGKQVFTGQISDDTAIDIQHLPSGLYTYALENNQQHVFDHGKWVKQ